MASKPTVTRNPVLGAVTALTASVGRGIERLASIPRLNAGRDVPVGRRRVETPVASAPPSRRPAVIADVAVAGARCRRPSIPDTHRSTPNAVLTKPLARRPPGLSVPAMTVQVHPPAPCSVQVARPCVARSVSCPSPVAVAIWPLGLEHPREVCGVITGLEGRKGQVFVWDGPVPRRASPRHVVHLPAQVLIPTVPIGRAGRDFHTGTALTG